MHLKHTIQTQVEVVGRGNDGSPLRTWLEGDRRFVEVYEYHQVGDFSMGLVIVKEVL